MKENFKTNRFKVFSLSAGISLGFIVIFGGLGYMADLYLGTKPFGLIIGLILSFPLTQLYLIKKVKKLNTHDD